MIHFFIAEYHDSERASIGGGVEDERDWYLNCRFPGRWKWARSGEIRDGRRVIA